MKEIISIEEVFAAYYECRKRKRRKHSSMEFEMDYEKNLVELWRELNSRTYEIGYSKAFCVTRPKLREVFCANFRDRIVHHLLMRKLMPAIESEMIDDSYNCRKGKGTGMAVRRIKEQMEYVSENYTKSAYVIKCDLQGFFMSIDKDVLIKQLEGFMERHFGSGNTPLTFEEILYSDNYEQRMSSEEMEWWLWLIEKVVRHRPELRCFKTGDKGLWKGLPDNKSLFTSNGKGLPIGNLTSQIFANYYNTPFDHWIIGRLRDICEERKFGYGRYVDDWYIIVTETDKVSALKLIEESRRWLWDNLRLKLHPDKVYCQHVTKGCEFVGAVIKPGRVYAGNRTVHNAFTRLEDTNVESSVYAQRVNSYLGHLAHLNTYAIRRSLWKKASELMPKTMICEGMKKVKVYKKYDKRKININKVIKERIKNGICKGNYRGE